MQKTSNRSALGSITGEVKTVGRLFSLLELFAQVGLVSISDVVAMLSIPRPTANRYLKSLEHIGIVQKSPYYGKYCLSSRAVSIAHLMLSSSAVYAPIKNMLAGLSLRTGESTNISVMSLGSAQFVVTAEAATRVQHIQAGMRVPLHTSAVGHVFLAHMEKKLLSAYLETGPWEPVTKYTITDPTVLDKQIEKVKGNVYAINKSGYLEGVVGVAVPIFDRDKRTLAALGLYVAGREKKDSQLIDLIPAMRLCADRIGKILSE
jgi:IclR family acetate operon transcriptional repressor